MSLQSNRHPFFRRAALRADLAGILETVAQCEADDKLIRATDDFTKAHAKAQKMAHSNGMPNWDFLFTEDGK